MAARGELARVVDIIAGQFVDAITIAAHHAASNAGADMFGQRAAYSSFADNVEVISAHGQADIAFQLVARLGGDQIDCAAGGVAAIQRALRAAQYFNALQIEHRTELCLC